MNASTLSTTQRNATLADLAALLTEQGTMSADFVVPAHKMRMEEGILRLSGTDPLLTDDGVTLGDGAYRPTAIFDEGVAAKLNIPLAYVRRLRAERPDLYDGNVNGWLHGRKAKVRTIHKFNARPEYETLREAVPGDARSFLVRTFKGTDGGEGIARALLSDSFRLGMDNLDALTAALQGIREADVDVDVTSADLSERRMIVKIVAPQLQVLAPELLAGYRSPFGNLDDKPVIFAGLVLSNSETGNGAFTLVPRFVVQICGNGWTVTKDAMRAVHVGGKLEEGAIDWSSDTQRKQADLIAARTRDAVATFLDIDYMRSVIREAEAKIKPVTDAQATVTTVCKKLSFTEAQTQGVLDHFIKGGALTNVGIVNAITSFSQTVADPDTAFDIESAGPRVLDLV